LPSPFLKDKTPDGRLDFYLYLKKITVFIHAEIHAVGEPVVHPYRVADKQPFLAL
jgi:hypothetical protein